MQLYYFETMNPRKVCALAKHLDVPVDYVRLDVANGALRSPEHLARNPNGLAPVLVDGSRSIWESTAIMVHFATLAKSELWPVSDPVQLVEVMRWLTWDLCHFAPYTGTYYFENLVKPLFLQTPADQAALDAASEPLHKSAKILDSHLGKNAFIAGNSLTIADFGAAVVLPWTDEIKLPLDSYRHIRRWHEDLLKLDAWRNPWPALPDLRRHKQQ